jgi:hypothetical protein
LRTAPAALLCATLLAPTPAAAGSESEVASAFDAGDRLDLHMQVDYRYSARRSILRRELAGLPGTDPDGPIPVVKDLVFRGSRHELVPRLELGVFTDLSLTAALPVVLRDSRRLDFDQRAGDCVFAGDLGAATCVDASNSTTIRDTLLPEAGFDATRPGAGGFGPGDPTIFRGVDRSGLDQLHLGLVWAPMNQQRDSTKPTWKLGGELRLPVGQTMRLDPTDPGSTDGVGRGLYEVKLSTSMARRLSWAEPFFEIWWLAAAGVVDGAPLDELPEPFAAASTAPQQRAGGRFGFEGIAWQSRTQSKRVGIRLEGKVEAHFEGRAYSDMWEVFAYAGHARSGGVLTLDADPIASGVQAINHPGVTNVENYLTLGGRTGLDIHLGRRVRFDLGFQLDWDQGHLISFADAGVDGDDPDDVVDPGTSEVNPLHAPLIDSVGRRYRADDGLTYAVTGGLRLLL